MRDYVLSPTYREAHSPSKDFATIWREPARATMEETLAGSLPDLERLTGLLSDAIVSRDYARSIIAEARELLGAVGSSVNAAERALH